MARKRKQVDPKEKAKRQKIMAGVGGVLLLALLAFQVPRTLKMLHPQNMNESAPAATSTTAASPDQPLAPPSIGGGGGSGGGGATTTPDGLSDPNAAVAANSGQLVTFDRFRSKDPFSPQLKNATDVGSVSGGSGSTTTPKPAPSSGGTVPSTTPPPSSGGVTPVSTTGPSSPRPKYTSATIVVNGVSEAVTVGKPFPAAGPVFVLVSVAKSSAKIAVDGGSYENGAKAITLERGKTLTLVNTADGTRYVLKLLATS